MSALRAIGRWLRGLGRWLCDYRNIGALALSVIAAFVSIHVAAGFHDRNALYSQLRSKDGQITALSEKVDALNADVSDLQAELEQVLAAHTDAERSAVVSQFEARRAAAAAVPTSRPAGSRSTTTTRPPTSPTTRPPPATTTTTSTTRPAHRCLLPCLPPITLP